MNDKITEIRELLIQISNKLEVTRQKIEQQSDDIKKYINLNLVNLDSNELIIAGLKSSKTSFELLRDEIDELQQLTIVLFNSKDCKY
jgi:hypothetical protein